MTYRIHLVPHTHWDREWYLPYQQFRIRLTRMMKQLLDILDRDQSYKSFHLDGQSIVLRDYLEIHPEDQHKLKKYIRSGRIKVGPWYVQPDEALVSGESLVRNFQMGIQIAEQFGESLRIGYLPDMFGHISQLPQILDGFNIRQVMFWRGLGEDAIHTHAEMQWQGSDDTVMFAYRLSNQFGYSELFQLFSDPEKAAEQIRNAVKNHLAPTAAMNSLLLMVGVDHMEPQKDFSDVLMEAAKLLPEYELIHSRIDHFMDEIQDSIGEAGILPSSLQGELRQTNYSKGGDFNFLLANVLSSRMYLKQKNAEAQNELERWAEPFSAVGFGLKTSYPSGLLTQSWDYLLQNHPHDSICGCSRDEVHRQMMTRFEWSIEISRQLAGEALYLLMSEVHTLALPEGHTIVHVLNPLEWEREDTVKAEIYLPLNTLDFRTIDIYDAGGKLLPSQVIDVCKELRAVNQQDTKVRDLVLLEDALQEAERGILVGFEMNQKVTVLITPDKLPPFGYATYTAIPNRKRIPLRNDQVHKYILENDFIKAEVQPNGSLRLLDKQTGHQYDDLLIYQDSGDIGDGYTYSPPLLDEIFSTVGLQASISVVEDGPVRSKLKVEHQWFLPESIAPNRKRRSEEKVCCKLITEISLGVKDRWIGVTTEFHNLVRDHRLSVTFPTGMDSEFSWASSAFDLVERSIQVRQPEQEYWIEDAIGVFPNQSFAGITDSSRAKGFAVAPYGLPEYECNQQGEIRLTLLRAVGYLGAPDPITIVAGAGPNFPTPEGQCQGLQIFRYALIPHTGDPNIGEVWRKAMEHHLSARTIQLRRHEGTLSLTGSFLKLGDGSGPLVLSSIKKAWDRDTLVVRLFNPTGEEAISSLQWWQPIGEAYKMDLQESRIEQLVLTDRNEICFAVGAKKIMTIELVLAN